MNEVLKLMEIHMERICRFLEKILEYICLALAVVLLASTFTGVVLRYILTSMPGWVGEELPSFLLMWIASIGMAIAVRRGSHLSIDLLARFLKGKINIIYNLLLNLAGVTFYCLLFNVMWEFCIDNRYATSVMLNVPMIWVYGSVLLGSIFSLIFVFSNIISNLRSLIERENSGLIQDKNLINGPEGNGVGKC